MKKVITGVMALALISTMAFGLVGCGKGKEEETQKPSMEPTKSIESVESTIVPITTPDAAPSTEPTEQVEAPATEDGTTPSETNDVGEDDATETTEAGDAAAE